MRLTISSLTSVNISSAVFSASQGTVDPFIGLAAISGLGAYPALGPNTPLALYSALKAAGSPATSVQSGNSPADIGIFLIANGGFTIPMKIIGAKHRLTMSMECTRTTGFSNRIQMLNSHLWTPRVNSGVVIEPTQDVLFTEPPVMSSLYTSKPASGPFPTYPFGNITYEIPIEDESFYTDSNESVFRPGVSNNRRLVGNNKLGPVAGSGCARIYTTSELSGPSPSGGATIGIGKTIGFTPRMITPNWVVNPSANFLGKAISNRALLVSTWDIDVDISSFVNDPTNPIYAILALQGTVGMLHQPSTDTATSPAVQLSTSMQIPSNVAAGAGFLCINLSKLDSGGAFTTVASLSTSNPIINVAGVPYSDTNMFYTEYFGIKTGSAGINDYLNLLG